MKELWVEKYRPNKVDGYVFVDDAQRDQVQQWIRDGSIPHLMLSGSAGTGKTTLAKLLINERIPVHSEGITCTLFIFL